MSDPAALPVSLILVMFALPAGIILLSIILAARAGRRS
jgi:hypothetical protein